MAELLTPRWGMPKRRYHRAQHESRTSTLRGRVMDCGRRSGKTLLSTEILVSHLLDWAPGCPQMRYVCGAPVQEQANEIFFDLLLDLIPESWIPGGRHGSNVRLSDPRKIILANGAVITIAGLDKPHRIEGKWLNGFLGSEWSDVRPGVFDKTIRPMLADYHGWYILEGVPKRQGVGARWYKQLINRIEAGEYPDCGRWTWPAWDIMDPLEVAEAQTTMDPQDFQEQYGAQWLNAGGSVFSEFSKEHNTRPCYYRPNLPIIVGQDFNRTPMCWVLAHVIGETLEVFDEIVLTNTTTQRALTELHRRYGSHESGFKFYGDASGRSGSTSSEYSDYAIIANDERFKALGRTLHYPPANPSRHDRFSAANARLCNAKGERRVFIDNSGKCPKLIEDLEMRAYVPGTMKLPENEGGLGHMSDSLSYILYRIWPIKIAVGGRNDLVYTTDLPPLTMAPVIDPNRFMGANVLS